VKSTAGGKNTKTKGKGNIDVSGTQLLKRQVVIERPENWRRPEGALERQGKRTLSRSRPERESSAGEEHIRLNSYWRRKREESWKRDLERKKTVPSEERIMSLAYLRLTLIQEQ